jgi:hypothetical protein
MKQSGPISPCFGRHPYRFRHNDSPDFAPLHKIITAEPSDLKMAAEVRKQPMLLRIGWQKWRFSGSGNAYQTLLPLLGCLPGQRPPSKRHKGQKEQQIAMMTELARHFRAKRIGFWRLAFKKRLRLQQMPVCGDASVEFSVKAKTSGGMLDVAVFSHFSVSGKWQLGDSMPLLHQDGRRLVGLRPFRVIHRCLGSGRESHVSRIKKRSPE